MFKQLEKYFTPFMALVVIYFSELCSCTQVITGSLDGTSIVHFWAIVLAFFAYSQFFIDLQKNRITKKNTKVFIFLLIILILYTSTFLFYGFHSRFFSYLLVFIAESISASIIGMKLAKSNNIKKIDNILPFFLIPFSLLIGTIGLRYAAIGERIRDDESGLGYQSLSYMMAFSYSYACYLGFFKERIQGFYNNVIRILMIFMMFFCALICLVGGGRGAFVFIITISLFFVYKYFKISKKHHVRAIVILVCVAAASVWLINYFNVMDSVGMLRVMGKLTEDDNRMNLYDKAYNAFLDSPIWGNGLGSIWWTVGYYSHNMLLDLLAEGGIFWTSIIVYILLRTLFKLNRYSKKDRFFLFLLIVMLGALVRNTFSGYWVSAPKLFLLCAMMYCMPNEKYLHRS